MFSDGPAEIRNTKQGRFIRLNILFFLQQCDFNINKIRFSEQIFLIAIIYQFYNNFILYLFEGKV